MRRSQRHARPFRPPTRPVGATADRVGMVGTTVVVIVGLGLTAITERTLLVGSSDGIVDARGKAGPTAGPAPSRTVRPAKQRRVPPPVQTLTAQVRSLTVSQRGAAARKVYGGKSVAPPKLGATRLSADKTWAFGTTAIPVPAGKSAMPQVFLYLAHWTGGHWRIGLTGGSAFAGLLRKAPNALIPAAERRALAAYDSASVAASPSPSPSPSASPSPSPTTGKQTGLMLPWKLGDIWNLGKPGPPGTVTFQAPAGDGGRALAAAAGRIYHFCTTKSGHGLVLVIHGNGVASVYYGLTGVTTAADGSAVKQGAYLGKEGTDRSCGGASGPAAVIFGLRGGSADIPVVGASIGGWTFDRDGASSGLLSVVPGAPMMNFGTDPAKKGSGSVPKSGKGNNGNGGSTSTPQITGDLGNNGSST
jgi:hypothetical protein